MCQEGLAQARRSMSSLSVGVSRDGVNIHRPQKLAQCICPKGKSELEEWWEIHMLMCHSLGAGYPECADRVARLSSSANSDQRICTRLRHSQG